MSTQRDRADALYGRTVYSSDGEKLGTVDDVLVDDRGEPVYIETKKGLFSGKRHVVPVSGMAASGDDLTVAYTKEQLENAPSFDDEVDYERERQLGSYYGTDVRDWDDAMTRSEEELRVGTRQVEAGRVRLRKWIETEPASETVTTRRETARVEREPITDANVGKATSGPELSEQEHEVTLTAEEAVAEKRTVPKERVRLETDTVTEEETVSDEIRKERIEVEGDVDPKGDKRRRKR
jgi:uncharacterized protein (TIGR02271 family)